MKDEYDLSKMKKRSEVMKEREEQSQKQKKINKEVRQQKRESEQKALKEKHKIESIISEKRDNLSISIDYDDNWDDVSQRYPVMLFTPDLDNTCEHWHIELSDEQAKKLHSWLGEFLVMKGVK